MFATTCQAHVHYTRALEHTTGSISLNMARAQCSFEMGMLKYCSVMCVVSYSGVTGVVFRIICVAVAVGLVR
jgi:hypothetical protein